MYKCENFIIQELVPRHVYTVRGYKSWELLNENALITLDQLREKYGKMIINNWYWDGNRQWSGLRTDKSPYGTAYSQHRFGNAFDIIFSDISAEAVRQDVLNNPNWFPFITGLEMGVSWFHFDVRNFEGIKEFGK